MAGLFIAFEGGEGAGKTTQSQLLADRLDELGKPCRPVREPGGTELGEYLRAYLKSERPLSREAELLLFAAARVELVTAHVRPALEQGIAVIADRFYGSTVAYQGHGRGLDLGLITALNGFATQGIRPDLTILLDLPPSEGLQRTKGRQMAFSVDPAGGLAPVNRTEEGTRFEDLDLEFHEKARQGFLAQAENDPQQWAVIDAAQSVTEVSAAVWRVAQERLRELSDPASNSSAANGEEPPRLFG